MKNLFKEYVLPVLVAVVASLPIMYAAAVAQVNVRWGHDTGGLTYLYGGAGGCINVSPLYNNQPYEELFYKLGEIQGFADYGWKPYIGEEARDWVWPWEYDQIWKFCSPMEDEVSS